jgi:cytochrome c oxidase subunit 4
MIGTGLTVGASWIKPFSFTSLMIGIAIATVKATVVALFFMHLKYEDKLFYVTALFPILLFGIMMSFIMSDLYYVGEVTRVAEPHHH